MHLDVPVSSIMTENLHAVKPDDELVILKRVYQKQNFHHHVPVIENDKLIGIVSLIDFMYAISGASFDDTDPIYHNKKVKDIMNTRLVTLPTTATLKQVAEILGKGQTHSVLIAENGQLKGIVTSTDLINYCYNS